MSRSRQKVGGGEGAKIACLAPLGGFGVGLVHHATPFREDEAVGAACSACGGSLLFLGFVVVAVIAFNIALLVWVARDSKARGMDSSVIWMVLVMLTSVLGLILYVFSRPQGQLKQCPHCSNHRLQASAKCPHCGNP